MSRPPPGDGGNPVSLARVAATVCGTGYFPIAPGTAGSAVGVVLYWALYQAGSSPLFVFFFLWIILAVWSAGVVERESGRKDPPEIVADEVAGQLLCLMGSAPVALHLAAGFVVFRVLDIWKPFRRIEILPGGWGVVADDLVAGGLGWGVLALGRSMGYL